MHSSRFTPYLYVAPLIALLLFVFGYPLVRIFEFSFKMVRGIDGPIRARVDVAVEPLDARERCKVTIALDFQGHGIGKVLLPLAVRREARKEMPENLRRLKERLEGGAI